MIQRIEKVESRIFADALLYMKVKLADKVKIGFVQQFLIIFSVFHFLKNF